MSTENAAAKEFCPTTLQQAIKHFSDLDEANNFMVAIRWADGVVCPHCQSKNIGKMSPKRRVWNCKECKKQFSVKVGTVFEDSPLGLDKWLPALWLISNAKNGISSYEIHRALSVTQKTAWFMLHRIRLAMQQGSFEKIKGQAEADETFIGGKAKNMHKAKRKERIAGRGATGKEIVMGILDRGERKATKKKPAKKSSVRVKHVADTKLETLQCEIREHILPGAEIFTDMSQSYEGLNPEFIHQAVDHAVCYAIGQVHTNGIENFWCLLKRTIRGTYVSVDSYHLRRYLDEQAFRFNERGGKDADRFVQVLESVAGRRLTYKELTASNSVN